MEIRLTLAPGAPLTFLLGSKRAACEGVVTTTPAICPASSSSTDNGRIRVHIVVSDSEASFATEHVRRGSAVLDDPDTRSRKKLRFSK